MYSSWYMTHKKRGFNYIFYVMWVNSVCRILVIRYNSQKQMANSLLQIFVSKLSNVKHHFFLKNEKKKPKQIKNVFEWGLAIKRKLYYVTAKTISILFSFQCWSSMEGIRQKQQRPSVLRHVSPVAYRQRRGIQIFKCLLLYFRRRRFAFNACKSSYNCSLK